VVLDEFDQLEDSAEIIYDLKQASEEAENELGLILIANEDKSTLDLDPRSQSRLRCNAVEFTRYNAEEIADILEQRADEAFRPRAVSDHAPRLIADIVADDGGDCRQALNMLLRAGRRADRENADKVTAKHVQQGRHQADQQVSAV
jgi:cell division control protein 6